MLEGLMAYIAGIIILIGGSCLIICSIPGGKPILDLLGRLFGYGASSTRRMIEEEIRKSDRRQH